MGPGQVIEAFAARLSDGEVEAALALYEPDARFVVEPGRVVSGHDAIRAALATFAALEPRLTGDIEELVQTDELALVVNRWTLVGVSPDGEPVRMMGRSADVLRRSPAGDWRIAIDDPWGGGPGRDSEEKEST
jgi:uncharacterized protein (TIGR02246 family)